MNIKQSEIIFIFTRLQNSTNSVMRPNNTRIVNQFIIAINILRSKNSHENYDFMNKWVI